MNKERQEAEEKFEQALKDLMATKGHDEGLLMDWVVITASHIQEDDGPITANAVYVHQGQPGYRTAGLIEYGNFVVNRSFGR